MEIKNCLTGKINNNIPNSIFTVLKSISLSVKNLRNCCLFVINNIQTSYQWNKEKQIYVIKEKLHENQKLIIQYANQAIEYLNNIKISKNKNEKLFCYFTSEIDEKTYKQSFNANIIENTVKIKEQNDLPENKSYDILPSVIAQPTVLKICLNFSTYTKSKIDYHKNPDKYPGFPEKPSYKEKLDYCSFEIDPSHISKKGFLPNIREKHPLYSNYEKTEKINQEFIDEYNVFNFHNLIMNDIESKNILKRFDINKVNLRLLRFIPNKRQNIVDIEYVYEIKKELNGIFKDLNILSQQKFQEDYFELKDNQQNIISQELLSNNNYNFISIDPGKNNYITMCYITDKKQKADIITAGRLNNKINNLEKRMDEFKSTFSSSSLSLEDYRALCQKQSNLREEKKSLSFADLSLLKQYCKEMYSHPEYNKLLDRKNNILKDYLHKLSHEVIQQAIKRNIQLIIVGKNKQQKSRSNLNTNTNREMHNLSHVKFYELLKYKARLNNILVIETEESYTSKTSFIDNETLQTFGDNVQIQLSGKRDKHVFRTKSGINIHADMNGAYNIARKVIKKFSYDKEKISLHYNLIDLKLNSNQKLQNLGFFKNPIIAK